MADNTRDQDLPGGQFHVAPDFEFMFVTDVAGFDQVRLGVDTEHGRRRCRAAENRWCAGHTQNVPGGDCHLG
jgi:hypothetical protein